MYDDFQATKGSIELACIIFKSLAGRKESKKNNKSRKRKEKEKKQSIVYGNKMAGKKNNYKQCQKRREKLKKNLVNITEFS